MKTSEITQEIWNTFSPYEKGYHYYWRSLNKIFDMPDMQYSDIDKHSEYIHGQKDAWLENMSLDL